MKHQAAHQEEGLPQTAQGIGLRTAFTLHLPASAQSDRCGPTPNRIVLLFAENSANAENSAVVPAGSTSFSAAYEWTSYCTLSVQVKVAEIKDDVED